MKHQMNEDQIVVDGYMNDAIKLLNSRGLYPDSWEGITEKDRFRIETLVIDVAIMIQRERHHYEDSIRRL